MRPRALRCPSAISEDAASLLPDQIRSTYVWALSLDGAGEVQNVSLRRARVRSRPKLSYEQVQADIDAGTATPVLLLLKKLGLLRLELEAKRGGASLNIPVTEIEHDGSNYLLARRSPLAVENWNAQISLMTAMAAATMMLDAQVGILRTMPAPESNAIAVFRLRTDALGHPWRELCAHD